MDFIVLDSELEKTYNELQLRINRLQNGGTINSLEKIGANTDNQIGASLLSLKQLASRYLPNEKLASLLWRSGKREQQIIACFLFSPTTNREIITQLGNSCTSFEVAEYLGSMLLSRHINIPDIIRQWSSSTHPHQQTAALTAAARHIVQNRGKQPLISADELQQIANKTYTDKYVELVALRYRFQN